MKALMAAVLVTASAIAFAGDLTLAATSLQGPSMLNPNAFQIYIPKLACMHAGTPVEFPDDIILVNKGTSMIPAGTKVLWKMTNLPQQGVYTFSAPLAPNKMVFLSGALGYAMEAGKPCTVKFI